MILKFPRLYDHVKNDFMRWGVWEKRTTEYIKKHLKKGQVFMDVGSHVGYYAILASSLGAEVLAFEPASLNRKYLIDNIQFNGCRNITVIGKALSNKSGIAKLYKGNTPGEYSLKSTNRNLGLYEIVESIKFDDVYQAIPDFIKIDIEGNEIEALMGMQSVLTTQKPITLIFEDWDGRVTRWVTEYGFRVVSTDNLSGNVICIKNLQQKRIIERSRYHLLEISNDWGSDNKSLYLAKIKRIATKLRKLGHYIIFYGSERGKIICDEFISLKENNHKIKSKFPNKELRTVIVQEMKKRKRSGDVFVFVKTPLHRYLASKLSRRRL